MVSYLPITIVPNETFHQSETNIYISYSLAKYWKIEPLDTIQLCLGVSTISVEVKMADIEKDVLHINPVLLKNIQVPQKESRFLSQYCHKDKCIYLGPIIGLMTELEEDSVSKEPDFRSVHSFCEELHHVIASIGGLFYVFHPRDFGTESTNCYYFDDGEWVKGSFGLPDVIYNRVHSRRLEASSSFNKILEQIHHLNIPIFNAKFLSKIEVHEMLFSEEHLHPYLPDTSTFTEQTLSTFLKKYPSVFIKPIHGSQGRNIIRLDLTEDGIQVVTSSGKSKDSMTFKSADPFIKWFKPRMNKSTYLIQQTIPLLTLEDRHLDFRVLCHKNYQERWRVTSVVARVSAEEQFVSNVARGGETMKPLKPLTLLFGKEIAVQQVALIKELALETANIVSQSAPGNYGEFGIDIGVDHEGKMWIIEVNSKPSKSFEEHDVKIRPSSKAIIEYSTALAFNKRDSPPLSN
ncbi:YheC/YheD family protein [Bacillus sp. 31A1R]|uniref:YheC/YheD family protein n=1 Tax=Robertmurraya mangrovi TaxID=3098077 RepID=A0ABU5ISR2_9BACI|nr:YheC/YheD family protein [Bacillus sp. 31A1R]MDZ5470180.1 YheC/YheD family protein [Bacillus sp. 31A1R]